MIICVSLPCTVTIFAWVISVRYLLGQVVPCVGPKPLSQGLPVLSHMVRELTCILSYNHLVNDKVRGWGRKFPVLCLCELQESEGSRTKITEGMIVQSNSTLRQGVEGSTQSTKGTQGNLGGALTLVNGHPFYGHNQRSLHSGLNFLR